MVNSLAIEEKPPKTPFLRQLKDFSSGNKLSASEFSQEPIDLEQAAPTHMSRRFYGPVHFSPHFPDKIESPPDHSVSAFEV